MLIRIVLAILFLLFFCGFALAADAGAAPLGEKAQATFAVH